MRRWLKIAVHLGTAAVLLSLLAIATLSATSVLAAPGGNGKGNGNGNGGGGEHSITVPDGTFAGTAMATVNPGGDNAWVHAECFQDGSLVYVQNVEVDENSHAMLTFGPTPSWTGGSADCTADELRWNGKRFRTLASTTFHVDG